MCHHYWRLWRSRAYAVPLQVHCVTGRIPLEVEREHSKYADGQGGPYITLVLRTTLPETILDAFFGADIPQDGFIDHKSDRI